jgi:hypothetical protein
MEEAGSSASTKRRYPYMSKKRTILAGVVLLLALAGAAVFGLTRANATGGHQVMDALRATQPFHDLSVAQNAGYKAVVTDINGKTCIAQAGAGGMGVHYLNPAYLDDSVNPRTPEALVYAPVAGGNLKLVALEYIVFQSVWDANHSSPPKLFGRQFNSTPAPNRFGIPAFYSLHLWIWYPNSSGMFEPWNPQVVCPS